MTDFRALVTEMADELDYCQQLLFDDRRQRHALADHARALLAEPEAVGPSLKELALWQVLAPILDESVLQSLRDMDDPDAERDHHDAERIADYKETVVDLANWLALEPEAEEPTDEELRELWQNSWDTSEEQGAFQFARAILARWGNHPGSPDSSDGPAVSDDREPASVMDQLKHQLLSKAKADLIRQVIHQALRDTADCHWRVADTTAGEQLVRVRDLLAWAEHMEKQMEHLNA